MVYLERLLDTDVIPLTRALGLLYHQSKIVLTCRTGGPEGQGELEAEARPDEGDGTSEKIRTRAADAIGRAQEEEDCSGKRRGRSRQVRVRIPAREKRSGLFQGEYRR